MIVAGRRTWTATLLRVALLGVAAPLSLDASIACDAKPQPAGLTTIPEVPLVAPFDQMKLPTSEGRVWRCTGPVSLRTPAAMRVAYDGVEKMVLGGRYATAITGAGWARRAPPTVTPERWLSIYDDADTQRTLTLTITDSTFDGKVPHGVDVSLTILIARPR